MDVDKEQVLSQCQGNLIRVITLCPFKVNFKNSQKFIFYSQILKNIHGVIYDPTQYG